jgi:hypothetical protein
MDDGSPEICPFSSKYAGERRLTFQLRAHLHRNRTVPLHHSTGLPRDYHCGPGSTLLQGAIAESRARPGVPLGPRPRQYLSDEMYPYPYPQMYIGKAANRACSEKDYLAAQMTWFVTLTWEARKANSLFR